MPSRLYADPAAAMEELSRICRDAWHNHLLSGCNGNASVRLPARGGHSMPQAAASGPLAAEAACTDAICITCTGAAKGRLQPENCCVLPVQGGNAGCAGSPLLGGPASSEAGMHVELYRRLPQCQAVLHCHPRHMLALSLKVAEKDFLELPLFEAKTWRAKLGFVPFIEAGTPPLACAVAQEAVRMDALFPAGAAVWMAGHGLCCWNTDLAAALSMAEELEHMAAIQLLSL